MSIPLASSAGLPLRLDPDSLIVTSDDGTVFERSARTVGELQDVLHSAQAAAPDTVVYYTLYPAGFPPVLQKALDRYSLTYSLVLIPPGRVGREFFKTRGHYHPEMPGTAFAYPEVYTGLHGEMLLLMQKRSPHHPDRLEDCVLTRLNPAVSVTVPSGYAHVLINATDRPVLMAGLYSTAFSADPEPIQAQGGMAYYILARDGEIEAIPNAGYRGAPPLRRLDQVDDTIFAPPDPDLPLWTAYHENPDRYAFLASPDARKAG